MNADRQLFAQWLVRRRNCTPSTAYTYEHNLRMLERTVGKPAEEIVPDDLELVFLMSAYAPSTKNGGLVAMRAYDFFRAKVLHRCDLNGLQEVRGARVRRQVGPSLTRNQVREILAACKRSRELRVIRLGLFAGTRVSDSAQIGAVHWAEDRLAFTSIKNGKWMEIPLHPELVRYEGRILAATTSRDVLKHTCKSLSHYTGIRFSSHSLRRSFAGSLLDAGVQEGVVTELLGHAQRSTLRQSYAGVTWRERVDAIARLAY